MDLQEHLNENPRLREWYECVSTEAENLAKQGYNLVPGWPADEYNLIWDDYRNWCHDQLDKMDDGDNAPQMQPYIAWRDARMPDGDEGFTWMCCDLCGGKAGGNRYAVSAVRQEPYDYIPYAACSDCMQFVANGAIPEDM